MDERGLWKLFFKTGRPEVYLAIAARRRLEAERSRPAKTAFHPRRGEV